MYKKTVLILGILFLLASSTRLWCSLHSPASTAAEVFKRASSRKFEEIPDTLLEKYKNAVDQPSGFTLLHWAAHWGCSTTARKLISLGANLDIRNARTQRTPLHWAAKLGHYDVARILVASGAHINAQDSDLQTPLHYATSSKSSAIVQLLLDAHADMLLKNKLNETARDITVQKKLPHLAQLFLNEYNFRQNLFKPTTLFAFILKELIDHKNYYGTAQLITSKLSQQAYLEELLEKNPPEIAGKKYLQLLLQQKNS